jgi:integrase
MKRIQPSNNNGNIRIRFSHQGKRHNINPGGRFHNRLDFARASMIAASIELDIAAGYFDTTLGKYRQGDKLIPGNKPRKTIQLIKTWDEWVETLGLSEETKADHYEMVRRMIQGALPTIDDAEWFVKSGSILAPSTYNKRLGYLRRCSKWSMSKGLTESNPYSDIKPMKVIKVPVKPFTADEIKRIMEGFRESHPTYVGFIGFMFLTGCRTAEAIGLQWKRIDFDRGEVTIADSLPKPRGSKTRQRKETKTGSNTVLKMNDGLRVLLETIKRGGPDELIFKSPKGSHVDHANFRTAWVTVLKSKGIEYRKPYTSRHSLASHAIDQGLSLPEVAYILGHTDTRMVMTTYGHMINRPDLPDLNL